MIIDPAKPAATAAAPAGTIKDGDAYGFANDVIKASMAIPVIVDSWAPWCGPCKTLTPLLKKLVRQAGGRVRLVKINIDDNQDLAGAAADSVCSYRLRVCRRSAHRRLCGRSVREQGARVCRSTDARWRLADRGGVEIANEALASGDVATAANVFAQVLQQDPRHIPRRSPAL